MSDDVRQFWQRATPRVIGRRDGFEWDDGTERAATETVNMEELARKVATFRASERLLAPELVRAPSSRVRYPDVGTMPRVDLVPAAAVSVGVLLAIAACFVLFVVGTIATVAIS